MPCTAPYHIFLSMFYPVGMKHNERVSRILLMYHMAQKSLIPRDSQDNLCICIFSELCHSSVSVLICTESLLRHGRSIRDNEKKHIHVDKFIAVIVFKVGNWMTQIVSITEELKSYSSIDVVKPL